MAFLASLMEFLIESALMISNLGRGIILGKGGELGGKDGLFSTY